MTDQEYKGTVKWFDSKKGFGFIVPEGGNGNQKDIFVHISAVEKAGIRTLNEGEQVFYDLEDNRGKTQAVNISKAA